MGIGHNILPGLELRLVLGRGERRADGDTVDDCGNLSLTAAEVPGSLPRVSVSPTPNHGLGLVLRLRLGTLLVGRVLVALWAVRRGARRGWCLFLQRLFISALAEVCLVHCPGLLCPVSKDCIIVQSASRSAFSHPDQARRDRWRVYSHVEELAPGRRLVQKHGGDLPPVLSRKSSKSVVDRISEDESMQ